MVSDLTEVWPGQRPGPTNQTTRCCASKRIIRRRAGGRKPPEELRSASLHAAPQGAYAPRSPCAKKRPAFRKENGSRVFRRPDQHQGETYSPSPLINVTCTPL